MTGMKCLKVLIVAGVVPAMAGWLAGTVSAQTLTATASPTSLSFLYTPGNNLPAAQTVSVKASSGTPSYTLAITGSNTLWLTATPDTGKLTATLSVRVNPTSLAAGSYTATITVTVAGVANPINIPVTLVVNNALPVVSLSTNSLAFSSPPSPPAAQTIRVSTSGSTATFTATVAGTTWLTVSPASGLLIPGAPATLTISVDTSGLVPQTAPYTGRITLAAPGASAATKQQTITVSVSVSPQTPTITSIWPSTIPLNSAATTVTIRGTNFYAASVAKLSAGNTSLTTTVLGNSALMATIPANALNTAGALAIVVSNPAPGGSSLPANVTVGGSPAIQAVVNAASMLVGAVAPGELITLFGDSIGPATAASLADADNDGFVDSSLGGVTATVDTVAAPLIYVSQNQITLQVPYTVSLGTNKVISVNNGAGTPATTQVTIGATAPAMFTLDGSGAGPAAVLNYNAATLSYSVNGTANAAKLGDTIVLYLTGEGDYATAVTPRTGLIVPSTLTPIPQVTPLPTVTIGGALATVSYAGPAIGSVLGLLQMNVVVPATASTGASVPVVVTIGANASPSNVTVSLRP